MEPSVPNSAIMNWNRWSGLRLMVCNSEDGDGDGNEECNRDETDLEYDLYAHPNAHPGRHITFTCTAQHSKLTLQISWKLDHRVFLVPTVRKICCYWI
jgi:hypothetical protein